jgi:hypothetical protein
MRFTCSFEGGNLNTLSIIAYKLARAIYFMLKREEAFDMKKFIN